jgi:nucleotide-binding universal stress UspA family protein
VKFYRGQWVWFFETLRNLARRGRHGMADIKKWATRPGMRCAGARCAGRVPAPTWRSAMIALKNILVATDFSEPAGVALNYGRDLARTFHARLHVLHVVEDVLMHYGPDAGLIGEDLQANLEKVGWRDLEQQITVDDRRTIEIVPAVRSHVGIASGIVAYAKANAIDLIISGTHGRGAITHLLMGSVAERVVRMAPCPVLTVHAKEREFITPDALVATSRV